MTSKTLVFAGIMAAIISNNAMATGENTVTSKSYVDAQDATKQDVITTGMVTIGNEKHSATVPAVVMYDSTNDLTGNQLGLFTSAAFSAFDLGGNQSWDEGNLGTSVGDTAVPTVAAVSTLYTDMQVALGYRQLKKRCAGWPDGTTTYDTTHTDANCWLWTFPDTL